MSDPSLVNDKQKDRHLSDQVTHEQETPLPPWVRHYEEGVPAHFTIPDKPLAWLLDTTCSQYPNTCAFIYYGTRITYAQLARLTNRFAVELQRLGVQKGDRVAIALPNIPQFAIAFFAVLKVGAVAVPTNPLYTEREMQHQLVNSGAKVMIMLDMFYPVVEKVRQQTALEHVIITSITDFLPPVKRTLYPLTQIRAKKTEPGVKSKDLIKDPTVLLMQPMLKSSTKGGIELFNLPVAACGDDLAVLQYTGGTTGFSKGAMLTHRNLLANAMQAFYWVPKASKGQEITLCVAPFFHAYGLTIGMNLSILSAATMVLLPRFNAKEVVNAIRHYHPTMLPGIPTMYIAIMRVAGRRTDYLQSIKYCISGSAPLPAKVQTDFETFSHGKLVEGYGLSEAAPVTHCNPLTAECRNGTIGLPLPEVEAAIISPETGEPLPPGAIGEIAVKGPNIMSGYWQNEEETRAIFLNGWLRTGDIGKMDEEGYFSVLERAKDLIIASGFNVYPREVEEVLFTHPAIAEAAVTAVADSYRGETVAAFVVLKPGFEASEQTREDILAFCKQKLTAYKVPKMLKFLDSLPKSTIGKVLRRELRKSV